MKFTLSAHAIAAMTARRIPETWVRDVLANPDQLTLDSIDPTLRHAIGPIAQNQGRVLRVVYNGSVEPWHVVTVFFDRRLRNAL